MHRIASRAPFLRSTLKASSRSLPPPPPPPKFQCFTRSFSTAKTPTGKSHMPFKTITASVLLTSSLYMYSQGIVQAEAADLPSSVAHYSNSSPSMALAELKDKENRIAVHAKSTEELAMALFVYRLCALPWLVDAAPHLISISEKLGLQAPIYWFVKGTFFRHFCGGETPDECISSMDKLSQFGINSILDLSVEADLHLDANNTSVEGQSKYHRDDQQADVILKMTKTCIETAAGGVQSNAMVAVKVTAFSPPELLLRLNQAISALDQRFLEVQDNGNINAQGIRHVIEMVLPGAETEEQQQQRDSIVAHLESKNSTLDVIEFRKLFNLQGPGRDVWWKTTQNDTQSVLLTAEDLEAYDRMIRRLDEVCGLARDVDVSVMVDAEQSYFQDAIDHVAVNLQRKFNSRATNNAQSPTVFNTCKILSHEIFL